MTINPVVIELLRKAVEIIFSEKGVQTEIALVNGFLDLLSQHVQNTPPKQ